MFTVKWEDRTCRIDAGNNQVEELTKDMDRIEDANLAEELIKDADRIDAGANKVKESTKDAD